MGENGRVFTKCLDEVLASTSDRAPEPPSHQRISHAATSVIVANTLGVRKRSLLEEAIGEKKKPGWRLPWKKRAMKRWTKTYIYLESMRRWTRRVICFLFKD